MTAASLSDRALLVSAALAAAIAGCGGVADDELERIDVAAQEDDLRSNRSADRLVVYSNNIENMIFDWNDLVHFMAREPLNPDVFLVQQITSRAELERLTDFMSRRLGVRYTGVVAQNHPSDTRFSGDVLPRPKVTTGIVWRSSRFELAGRDSWMPFGRGFSGHAQTCEQRSNNSGYETLRVRLFDKLAKKHVVLVSLRHWTWEPCSNKNVSEIVNGFDGGRNDHGGLGDGAALQIVAGDFNDGVLERNGDYKCWYRKMVRAVGPGDCGSGDHGFTDPLFEACDGEKSCMRRRSGIDSLFVRGPDARTIRTSHFDTVTWEEAHRASVAVTGGDGPSNDKRRDGYRDVADRYSGHEARVAWVYYP